MRNERVLGVDACRTGWVGVALEGASARAYFEKAIEDLVARAVADSPVAVVAVDMPIGLPDRGTRQADLLAHRAVDTLRSSVFTTPVPTGR